MSARTVLEPGDAHCAWLVRMLREDLELSPHLQRVILATYLATRAGDDASLGDLPNPWPPATHADEMAFRRRASRWARESGWYDTAKLVLAS
jgi:hypothetical protein